MQRDDDPSDPIIVCKVGVIMNITYYICPGEIIYKISKWLIEVAFIQIWFLKTRPFCTEFVFKKPDRGRFF